MTMTDFSTLFDGASGSGTDGLAQLADMTASSTLTPNSIQGVDATAGPTRGTLPPATGSKARIVVPAVNVDNVLEIQAGDNLNGAALGSVFLTAVGETVLFIDNAPGQWVSHPTATDAYYDRDSFGVRTFDPDPAEVGTHYTLAYTAGGSGLSLPPLASADIGDIVTFTNTTGEPVMVVPNGGEILDGVVNNTVTSDTVNDHWRVEKVSATEWRTFHLNEAAPTAAVDEFNSNAVVTSTVGTLSFAAGDIVITDPNNVELWFAGPAADSTPIGGATGQYAILLDNNYTTLNVAVDAALQGEDVIYWWDNLAAGDTVNGLGLTVSEVIGAGTQTGNGATADGTGLMGMRIANADGAALILSSTVTTTGAIHLFTEIPAPVPSNLYDTDGTIASGRTVTMAGNDLTLSGAQDTVLRDVGVHDAIGWRKIKAGGLFGTGTVQPDLNTASDWNWGIAASDVGDLTIQSPATDPFAGFANEYIISVTNIDTVPRNAVFDVHYKDRNNNPIGTQVIPTNERRNFRFLYVSGVGGGSYLDDDYTTAGGLDLGRATTAERDALTGLAGGEHLYNTTSETRQWYHPGSGGQTVTYDSTGGPVGGSGINAEVTERGQTVPYQAFASQFQTINLGIASTTTTSDVQVTIYDGVGLGGTVLGQQTVTVPISTPGIGTYVTVNFPTPVLVPSGAGNFTIGVVRVAGTGGTQFWLSDDYLPGGGNLTLANALDHSMVLTLTEQGAVPAEWRDYPTSSAASTPIERGQVVAAAGVNLAVQVDPVATPAGGSLLASWTVAVDGRYELTAPAQLQVTGLEAGENVRTYTWLAVTPTATGTTVLIPDTVTEQTYFHNQTSTEFRGGSTQSAAPDVTLAAGDVVELRAAKNNSNFAATVLGGNDRATWLAYEMLTTSTVVDPGSVTPVDIGHHRFVASADNTGILPASQAAITFEAHAAAPNVGTIATFDGTDIVVTAGANAVELEALVHTDGTAQTSAGIWFRDIADAIGVKFGDGTVSNGVSSRGTLGEGSANTLARAVVAAGTTVTLQLAHDASSDSQLVQTGSYIDVREVVGQQTIVLPNTVTPVDAETVLDEQSLTNGGTLTLPADLSPFAYVRFEVDDLEAGGIPHAGSREVRVAALPNARVNIFEDGLSFLQFDMNAASTTATLIHGGSFVNNPATVRVIGVRAQQQIVPANAEPFPTADGVYELTITGGVPTWTAAAGGGLAHAYGVELPTGDTFNGAPVFTQAIDISSLSNGTQLIAFGIVAQLLNEWGRVSTGGTTYPAPIATSSGAQVNTNWFGSGTAVNLQRGGAFTTAQAGDFIVLEYTRV